MKCRLFFLLVLVSGITAHAVDFYVSPEGAPEASGSREDPFVSLQQARDAVRPIAGDKPVTVWIHGGLYPVTETLVFDVRDSGTKEFPVQYRAVPGETPVFSGGQPLTGWEQSSNGLWTVDTQGMEFRQMYVNGRKALRSRHPNTGHFFRLLEWNKPEQTLALRSEDIESWDNFKEIEIYMQMLWSISVMRLDSFENAGDRALLTVQNPERDLVFKRKWPLKIPDQAYHYENAVAFIDQPGEWSINRSQGVCTYKPRPGETFPDAEVIVPQLTTLLAVRGSFDHPVKYLEFHGLTFKHSGWLLPNERGYLNIQAGQYTIAPTVENIQYAGRPPAAVLVENGHHLRFHRNVFKKLGAVGLDLHFGTRDCEVDGNVFYDIAGSGISHAKLSDPEVEIHEPYLPKDPRELCVGDRIHNNYIRHIGYEYGGAIGILSGWPVELEIDHNELHDLAYTGISVGWGWTHMPNAMRDNKIRWNHIDSAMSLFGDGGGIYTLSRMPGTHIYRNFISNIHESEWVKGAGSKCIFLDEGSGGITLQENHEQVGDGIERLRLHVTGEITVKPKTFAMYPGIKAGAGLQPEYEDIKVLARD